MLTMSNPSHDNSPSRPSGSSSPESYHTKRVRNNLAVKKCREIKRKQEKEMLAAVTKQKELNKKLEEEYEKAKMEEQMLRAMLPFCTASQHYCSHSRDSSNEEPGPIIQKPIINNSNLSLASLLSPSKPTPTSVSSFSPGNYLNLNNTNNDKFQQNSQK